MEKARSVDKSENSAEMNRFNAALRQVLSVSKADLNKMLAEEKASKNGKLRPGPRPKSLASGHASGRSD